MKLNRIISLLLVMTLIAGGVFVLVKFGLSNETNDPVDKQTNEQVENTSQIPKADQTATYTIEYDVVWSGSTHPETLPAGAHVSPIVIASHQDEGALFASDTLATDGIEIMAETGATQVLLSEINANQSILDSAVGTRIDAPGTNTLEIELDQDHPLLSAVSMLAPSPDWFVAIRNVNLFSDGQWLEIVELETIPYDAGTDSEATFTTDNSDTQPAGRIGPPVDEEFIRAAAEGNFATITITRN